MAIGPGQNLGQYRILEQIGRGGMATVYKAYHEALARYAAIKVLPAAYAEDPSFLERFHREAITVANLRHPNIPAVYDSGTDGGVTYIVSEYVDGGTLAQRLGAPIPPSACARLLRPVASALDYAHGRGVIHRDVKPSNVLLTKQGTPLLSDFGIARLVINNPALTRTGMTIGTPEYMAPEQAIQSQVGPEADIYALAVIAYEMLTGRVPFSGETPLAVAFAHLHAPLPLPREWIPTFPEAIQDVLQTGLAKAPEARYQTASALIDALDRAIGQSELGTDDELFFQSAPSSLGALDATEAGTPVLGPALTPGLAADDSTVSAGLAGTSDPRLPDATAPGTPGPTPGIATPSDLASRLPPGPYQIPATFPAGSVESPRRQGDETVARPSPEARPLALPATGPARLRFARIRWVLAAVSVTAVAAGLAAAVAVPRFSGPPPMTGPFNVAITQFGEIDEMGRIVAWDQGPRLADATFLRVRDTFDSLADMRSLVQIQSYPTEAVSGRTFEERTHSAQLLAEKLRAHLVVYGFLQRDREQWTFSPELFAALLPGAEELLGRHQLGAPVVGGRSRSGLGEAMASAELSEELRARMEVFSLLAVGMAYLSAGRPPTAVDYFERADRLEGWQDPTGRDVVYVLLGSAYRIRGGDGDRGRAFAAYDRSLQLNPESARAYLGLGYLHYEEFLGSDCADDAALHQALLHYQKAASARLRPGSDYMEARIRLELGNAYLVKAQLGESDLFASARTELQWVIDVYERGNQRLEAAASHAYAGMGVIQERSMSDPVRAAELYRQALVLAGEDDELRELAEVQKDILQPSGPTGRDSGQRDAGTVAPTPTAKPARHC